MTNAISPSLLFYKNDCFVFTLDDSWIALDDRLNEFNDKEWVKVCDTLKGMEQAN